MFSTNEISKRVYWKVLLVAFITAIFLDAIVMGLLKDNQRLSFASRVQISQSATNECEGLIKDYIGFGYYQVVNIQCSWANPISKEFGIIINPEESRIVRNPKELVHMVKNGSIEPEQGYSHSEDIYYVLSGTGINPKFQKVNYPNNTLWVH